MAMYLDGYELPRPARGWSPPRADTRVVVDATQGGAVIHASRGAYADAGLELSFRLPMLAQETQVAEQTTGEMFSVEISSTQVAYAQPVVVPLSEFAALSVARLRLRKSSSGATGLLALEVWDVDPDSYDPPSQPNYTPKQKVGTLGMLDVASLGTAFGDVYLWSDSYALPLRSPGGFMVLRALALEGGSVHWASVQQTEPSGVFTALKRASGAWTTAERNALNHTAWQGSEGLVVRGFAEAYRERGYPETRTLRLDDGREFSVQVESAVGKWLRKCTGMADEGEMEISLRLQIVSAPSEEPLP